MAQRNMQGQLPASLAERITPGDLEKHSAQGGINCFVSCAKEAEHTLWESETPLAFFHLQARGNQNPRSPTDGLTSSHHHAGEFPSVYAPGFLYFCLCRHTVPKCQPTRNRTLLVPQQFLCCSARHPVVARFLVWDHVRAPLRSQSYGRTLFLEPLQPSLGDVPAEIHLQCL